MSIQVLLIAAPNVEPLYFPPHFTAAPHLLSNTIAALFQQASRYFTIPSEPFVIEMFGHETHAPYEIHIEIRRPQIH